MQHRKDMDTFFFCSGSALLCNLCHIAEAWEVGRRPGPSVIMNSFLVSLTVSGYLSLSLYVSAASISVSALAKIVFSNIMNMHSADKLCVSLNNRAVTGFLSASVLSLSV